MIKNIKNKLMDTGLFGAITRNHFYSFVKRAFVEADNSQPFVGKWHHELICNKLEQCIEGKIKRLIINLPPRNLKTFITSIALPAYILGKKPEARIFNISYNKELATRNSRICRNLINSQFYQS